MLGNFANFLSSAFLMKLSFEKDLSVILPERQIVWIKNRSNIMSGLIWFQMFAKGYQQATNVVTNKNLLKLTDRSGINTIKYHTCPRIPNGKVTKS